MTDLIKKIYDYSLEEIMGDRFGRYSKTIIQNRAIPDVRDGLKPVQRRILYSMYKEKNLYNKPYRKSARSVGDIMGKYHPHGDSSIYDAMVRMSQDWKMQTIYVDMHGNNGSLDGDSPAAMRYTEARLSKISEELLKDIDRRTVSFAPNYDDSLLEPTVLPAKYPNLLVNGATGISAGYATNIPPHNLGEIIDATIKRIDNPNCRLDTILEIIKAPDFPTGAIACGKDEIKKAYKTGKGRILIKSKLEFKKKNKKDQIIITEIPYEVNKATLVKKIDEIRIDKKIEGISEVRDETDRKGLRIAIDLNSKANKELIRKYLLKNTSLQVSYNINMVAIANKRPKLLGILDILDYYILHQKEVIIERTKFDKETAEARLHIVEGLIKAIGFLDEIVALIRKSKNKTDAKENLIEKYQFSEIQAEAIVMLQLYKLTNTDVTLLEEELNKLRQTIKDLKEILDNEDKLKSVMKKELKHVKNEYATARKTEIEIEAKDIKIDTKKMIPKEDVIVAVSKEGYIKRVSKRSYQSFENENTALKDGDYLIGLYELSTRDTILLFTNKGNYLYIPVHEIIEAKWKELGKHVSNAIEMMDEEKIIASIPVNNFKKNKSIVMFTKNGMIKASKLSDFKVKRYSKSITSIKLKGDDEVVGVTDNQDKEIMIITENGYSLWFDRDEISVVGLRTSGVKSINLKKDKVVSGIVFNKNDEYISIFTDKGNAKRIKLNLLEKSKRALRGLIIIRKIKSNPHKVIQAFITNNKIGCILKEKIKFIKTTDYPITDRYSNGSNIFKNPINYFEKKNLLEVQKIKEIKQEQEKEDDTEVITDEEVMQVSLKEVDDKIMTIDDFLDKVE